MIRAVKEELGATIKKIMRNVKIGLGVKKARDLI